MTSIFQTAVTKKSFQNRVRGTYGEFSTPAGSVHYLMTKARLGEDKSDDERRLTRHLVPVREVIPPDALDFSQLLQRDLDDHRVAVGLIPYLLKPATNGPAYFPPIVAVLLPFKSKQPSKFEGISPPSRVEDEYPWTEWVAGDSVRIRRLTLEDGSFSDVAFGEVGWNSESCQLVVVDGQHRAMALLAIDRTIRKAWHEGAGSKYRYFYESEIDELLASGSTNLDSIEVPVTILWFPQLFGEDGDPHAAARKLFVDVNKEARTPSESRLILLSDTELQNIFVRSVLKKLRNKGEADTLPLYCIEYDNPDTKTTQSARWSALTNIHTLKQMVSRSVFGPGKYIEQVDIAFGKREASSERDAFMREQLRVLDEFPPVLGGDFPREDLGNSEFPPGAAITLTDLFDRSWGEAIIEILSSVNFYAAHAKALGLVKDGWLFDDAISTLAHDALFGGVGMYWTLRESNEHWKRLNDGGDHKIPKPDVVKSWELLSAKQAEFERQRSETLFGSTSQVDVSNSVYQVVNTQACQLGLILSLATIHRCALADKKLSPPMLAKSIALGINAWVQAKSSGAYDRRMFLVRGGEKPKYPFNLISHMDTPRALQFRYFWLEVISSPEAAPYINDYVDRSSLLSFRDTARRVYVDYVASIKAKALKTSAPELNDSKRKDKAASDARKEIRNALKKWFEWDDISELDSFFDTQLTQETVAEDLESGYSEAPEESDEDDET